MEDNQTELREILAQWVTAYDAGKLSSDDLLRRFRQVSSETNSPHQLDLDRATRCGFPEAVYGEGKREADLVEIVARLQADSQPVLITRLDAKLADALQLHFPDAIYQEQAKTFRLPAPGENEAAVSESASSCPSGTPSTFDVAVITAGTTDIPVALEAIETLTWMNISFRAFHDLGVAGPHRLRARLDEIRQAKLVIVVAGMEGALPSVVGGYVSSPIIAVPTSVGYGAAFGGVAALLGMLNSCAANVIAVNIDAGFKAAYIAGLMITRCQKEN